MDDESSRGNTPPWLKNFYNDPNMDREGSDDDWSTLLYLNCSLPYEGPPQDGVASSASENDIAWMQCSEDYDSNASAHLDLTWETEEATLAKEHYKMQYPVADASSHVPNNYGWTLEDSHLTERHQPLQHHEESQHKYSDASAEAMEESHQPKSEDKDSLSLAYMQPLCQSLVSMEDGFRRCRQCAYVTKRKGDMDKHVRIHTGERPFQCSECPSAFTDKSYLREHMRTHTGERPFVCVHCRVPFSRNRNLVRHIRAIHRGELRFSCVHCHAGFSSREELLSHTFKCGGNKKP